jgi:hypothetical protein
MPGYRRNFLPAGLEHTIAQKGSMAEERMHDNPYQILPIDEASRPRLHRFMRPAALTSGSLLLGIATASTIHDLSLLQPYLYFGVGVCLCAFLLRRSRGLERFVAMSLFWLLTCLSFALSMYLLNPTGWRPNTKMVFALFVLPAIISEPMLRILDWFRCHWSGPVNNRGS